MNLFIWKNLKEASITVLLRMWLKEKEIKNGNRLEMMEMGLIWFEKVGRTDQKGPFDVSFLPIFTSSRYSTTIQHPIRRILGYIQLMCAQHLPISAVKRVWIALSIWLYQHEINIHVSNACAASDHNDSCKVSWITSSCYTSCQQENDNDLIANCK